MQGSRIVAALSVVGLVAVVVAQAPARAVATEPAVSFTTECRFVTIHAWWGLSTTWDVTTLDEELALFFDWSEHHPAHIFPANQQSSLSGYMGTPSSWEIRDPGGAVVQAGAFDTTECVSRPAFTGDAAPDPARSVDLGFSCEVRQVMGTAGPMPRSWRKALIGGTVTAGARPLAVYTQRLRIADIPAGESRRVGVLQHFGPEQDEFDNARLNGNLALALGSDDLFVIELGTTANAVVLRSEQPTCPSFVPVSPTRLLDTRPGGVTGDGEFAGIGLRAAGSITRLRVAERLAVARAPSAVELTVTATGTTAHGFFTVWPCDEPQPTASNLTYGPGTTVANTVVTAVDPAGDVCIYTLAATHMVVDLSGYDVTVAQMSAVNPVRLMDTRAGGQTIDGLGSGIGRRAPGSETPLQISARGPFAEPATVVLTVTATDAEDPGFVTVWPCGAPRPLASNLNIVPGATSTNTVVVDVAGETGLVCLYTSSAMHLIADAVAVHDVVADWPYVGRIRGVVPVRLADSRAGGQTVDGAGAGTGQRSAGSVTRVQVRGRGTAGDDVGAATLTVTVTEPEAPGFVTVWPCGEPQPTASNLNYGPGATVANLVSSPLDESGGVCIFTLAATHLVVDLNAVYGRSTGPL